MVAKVSLVAARAVVAKGARVDKANLAKTNLAKTTPAVAAKANPVAARAAADRAVRTPGVVAAEPVAKVEVRAAAADKTANPTPANDTKIYVGPLSSEGGLFCSHSRLSIDKHGLAICCSAEW